MQGSRQVEPKDTCGTYASEVGPDQPALECDVYERWEHVLCLHLPDRIEENLYTALVPNPSKALLFCCTACRRKGSIVKHLCKLQADLMVANEQRLASAHTVYEAHDLIEALKVGKTRRQITCASYYTKKYDVKVLRST